MDAGGLDVLVKQYKQYFDLSKKSGEQRSRQASLAAYWPSSDEDSEPEILTPRPALAAKTELKRQLTAQEKGDLVGSMSGMLRDYREFFKHFDYTPDLLSCLVHTLINDLSKHLRDHKQFQLHNIAMTFVGADGWGSIAEPPAWSWSRFNNGASNFSEHMDMETPEWLGGISAQMFAGPSTVGNYPARTNEEQDHLWNSLRQCVRLVASKVVHNLKPSAFDKPADIKETLAFLYGKLKEEIQKIRTAKQFKLIEDIKLWDALQLKKYQAICAYQKGSTQLFLEALNSIATVVSEATNFNNEESPGKLERGVPSKFVPKFFEIVKDLEDLAIEANEVCKGSCGQTATSNINSVTLNPETQLTQTLLNWFAGLVPSDTDAVLDETRSPKDVSQSPVSEKLKLRRGQRKKTISTRRNVYLKKAKALTLDAFSQSKENLEPYQKQVAVLQLRYLRRQVTALRSMQAVQTKFTSQHATLQKTYSQYTSQLNRVLDDCKKKIKKECVKCAIEPLTTLFETMYALEIISSHVTHLVTLIIYMDTQIM